MPQAVRDLGNHDHAHDAKPLGEQPAGELAGHSATNTSGTALAAHPSDNPRSISRNAMKVRKPARVLESRISIRHSTVNPCRSLIPQPGTLSGFHAARGRRQGGA
jgi:hypothetical protein